MKIAKLAMRVGSLTLVSRIFGYIRDIAIAFFLGASFYNDAFIIALRLPNLFRSIFGEGALSNTFVPIFSKKLSKEGIKASKEFAINVQTILLIILIIFSIIMMINMQYIIGVIAPGYSNNIEVLTLAKNLGLISFPYIIFISMMAFYGGISNSLRNYFPMASAPIILNVLLILFIFLGNTKVEKTYWLTISLPLAGIFEMLWVMFFVNKKIGYLKLVIPKVDYDTKLLFKRLVPGIIGSGLTQINVMISTIIASYVVGGVSYLYYADRIYQLPLAIVGTALGTVMLPELSKKISKLHINKFLALQNQAMLFSMYTILPATFAIMALSNEIISALFEYGEFNKNATNQTSIALLVFAFGLPMYCYIKIFSTAFFATGDTKTPVKITAFSILINVILSFSLLDYFQHVAIAFGSVISSYITAIVMGLILHRRNLYKLYWQTLIKKLKLFGISFGVFIFIICIKQFIFFESKFITLLVYLSTMGILYIGVCSKFKVYSFTKLLKK